MQPEDKDSAYLWYMLDAARTVAQFTSGLTIEKYLKDRKLQLAIERLLEIIGEAANRVSADFQQGHPEIPWRKIVGQRNVISHEYGILPCLSLKVSKIRSKSVFFQVEVDK